MSYVGIDQYGTHYNIKRYPRKELMEMLHVKSAQKMYVDVKLYDGNNIQQESRHIGYVISGFWITVYKFIRMDEVKE